MQSTIHQLGVHLSEETLIPHTDVVARRSLRAEANRTTEHIRAFRQACGAQI